LTIVAQIQNLRSFVTTHLGDVIDWNKHVKPDPHLATTGDIAYVEIETPFNRYKLAMGSAYAEPPSGAPSVCRSLGWITFHHVGEDKYLLSPKNDLAYMDISKHIHVRELTDAAAACRRDLAESATPELAAQVRIRMSEVAARAAKWDIKVQVPEASKVSEIAAAPQHHNVPVKTLDESLPIAHPSVANAFFLPGGQGHPGPAPFVGAQIIFYAHDRIAGMDQVPGVLVKIQKDGRAAMFLMADLNEITFMDNVHRRGSDAGNGRVHTTNCWDFNPEWLKEQARICHLEKEIKRIEDERGLERALIAEVFDDLLLRLAALEAKPKRGRPPKPEGGETEGAEAASELEPAT